MKLASIACILMALISAEAIADPISLFSPQGTVKQIRQATARFAMPMVALGDPRLADPFDIDCAAKGRGRWADERSWVYDFDADLPAGVRCTFKLRADLRDRDGAPVGSSRSFVFDSGGPAIRTSLPYEGSTVDEDQNFLLALDSQATSASIEHAAYCAIDGLAERVPVRVLEGAQRTAILDQRRELGYSYYQILWKDGARSSARVRDRSLEDAESQLIVVACRRALPPDTKLQLVWGAGIEAPTGIATTLDQKLAFQVRPAFTAHLQCERVNARAGCIPLQPIRLQFSAPVPAARANATRIVTADGSTLAPEPVASAVSTVEELIFKPPFPDNQVVHVQLAADVVDDIGRPLANADRFPLEVKIDEYPPLAKFSGEFGILEANEGAVLPVTLRNIEVQLPAKRAELAGRRLHDTSDAAAVAKWMQRVEAANSPRGAWEHDEAQNRSVWIEQTADQSVFGAADATETFTVPVDAGDGAAQRPFEVVGIPLSERGFYVVEIESRRLGEALLGKDSPRYVSTAALVTNLSVHFKWGRESSRVWVTRLDDAAPVADVDVEITDFCSGALRWHGRTDRDGIALVEQSFGEPHGNGSCAYSTTPLMISARTGDDFSFALSSWNEGIRPYDFALQTGGGWDAAIYHSVLDRPLFRAGETVSMKHFLRRHSVTGVELAEALPGEKKIRMTHLGSGATFELTASFDANGIAESTWPIPTEAKLGDYEIEIGEADSTWHESGHFKVEQFRLPTIRATVTGPADAQLRPTDVQLDLHATYLSGGGASGLPVKLRTTIEPRTLRFQDYDDYEFGGQAVVEGTTQSGASAYDFDPESGSPNDVVKARVFPVNLDGQGAARVSVPEIPKIEQPSVLNAEMDYADANGEILTSAGRVELWPSAITLGIRREGWAASSEQLRFRVVALDLKGHPVAGQRVGVTLYGASEYSYRKRLIGGFYAYDSVREVRRLQPQCSGKTDAQGLLSCEVAPGVAGEVIVAARTTDGTGNASEATTSIWVVGQDEWWFGGTTGDRMDLLPEHKEYEPGDTARFQVRMPFRNATALVTVEREGVISSFVTTLRGSEPIVEVPITDADSPNVFVSVLAVRGRVGTFFSWLSDIARRYDLPDFVPRDGGRPTALIELSKPSYRLGAAEIRVGWTPHRLDVHVSSDRPSFAVREQAHVKIHVARADNKPLPAGAEVALAAVDEALLDLAPNPSWNLLDAMMGRRGLEVWTATAQMEVVGRRTFGRKAVPHGGGGGRERARELFDTLLTWQGRVTLDANGDAEATIPLNDSLTSFRIVAVANAGGDLFGTGSTNIVTTQDLLLLSGLPPLVREGDRYLATFTVRNTTDHAASVEAVATTTPNIAAVLPSQRFDIAAGAARDIVWDVTAPIGTDALAWDVSLKDATGSHDRLAVRQKIIPAVPVRTFQATLAQLDPSLSFAAERPTDAIPGRGGLDISLQARLGDSLDGVRAFMASYPYVCLEQNLSKAVALGDSNEWDRWMERLPAYLDRNGLLKYFASDWIEGDDTLTAYALAVGNEAGYEIPAGEQQRMLQALTAFVEGRIDVRSALDTSDLTIRKLTAIEALSRYDSAEPRMLDSINVDPNNWPTSAVLDWLNVLRRVEGIANSKAKIATAEGIIRARLNFQGTTLGFSTERTDALWWLMISSDSNAARVLLTLMDRPAWREDMPRLVRGAIGRQQFGRWNTTVANAWGTLALEKFSAAFESTPVTGETKLTYGPFTKSLAWSGDAGELAQQLPWQDARQPVALTQVGSGRPWATVRATAAIPLKEPFSSGFTITRTVTAVEQQQPGHFRRGDVVRVHLDIDAQSDMTWVVIDDPVPAGATVLGSGLGGQSRTLTQDEHSQGWAWLAFEQRAYDAFLAYYRFVPKGRFSTEYTVRLNNPGTFQLPPTRVEAMYAPEMFGEVPNASVTVEPTP